MTAFRTVWAFQYRGVPLDLGAIITPETCADHLECQFGWNIGAVEPVCPGAPVDPPPDEAETPPVDEDADAPVKPPEVTRPPIRPGDRPPAEERAGRPVEPMTSHDGPTRGPPPQPAARPGGRR
jgi:hypothetical protein